MEPSVIGGEETGVLRSMLQSRVFARLAVVGLTAGLALLAALALWATQTTAATSAAIRELDETSQRWTQVLLHVSTEYEALLDFANAETDLGRRPLVSTVGSAAGDLAWLRSHGDIVDRAEAAAVSDAYDTYTASARDLVAAGAAGDEPLVRLKAAEVGLGASAVRKQAVANATRKHHDLTALIDRAEERNARLRAAEGGLLAVDLVLLAFSALILLNHQRRIEGQAVAERHRARHDALTGLPNRALLNDRLELAVRHAVACGRPGGLLMLDLDRFKEVNDTLGHHHGDLLLREVSRRLTELVGPDDVVARLGGDEFAVLLPAADLPAVTALAERIRLALTRPAELEDLAVSVEASIGAVVFPGHGDTAAELLRHADIAMYTAKRTRTGVAGYRPGEGEALAVQMSMLSELRRAIPAGELVLHYQPKLELATGRFAGVEALVRWRHPRRGLLRPAEFLPLAEHVDVNRPLNDWVLRTALSQQQQWRVAGLVVPVAVNLPGSLLLEELPDRVADAMAEHGCPPGELTLEVTESAVIHDPDRAVAILSRLRAAGVSTSIDDFGTGYSSMSRLLTLPLDELKVDREFTMAMITRNGGAIMRTVVQLGHTLDLRVVAEGVENAASQLALTELGCDQGQGNHISPPLDAHELVAWLADCPERSPPAPAALPAPARRAAVDRISERPSTAWSRPAGG